MCTNCSIGDHTGRLTPPPPHKMDKEQDEEHNDYEEQEGANHDPRDFPTV